MGLMLRLRLFVCGGMFMGCNCVKRGKEYLKLDKCWLKMMSGELEGS